MKPALLIHLMLKEPNNSRSSSSYTLVGIMLRRQHGRLFEKFSPRASFRRSWERGKSSRPNGFIAIARQLHQELLGSLLIITFLDFNTDEVDQRISGSEPSSEVITRRCLKEHRVAARIPNACQQTRQENCIFDVLGVVQ